MINFDDYLVSLIVGVRESEGIKFDRYVGIGFFVAPQILVTCKHITQMVEKGEVLVALCNRNGSEEYEIITDSIKEHPERDFAAIMIDVDDPKVFPITDDKYSIGSDIQAFGYVSNRKEGHDLHVDARYKKGYIVRTSDKPLNHLSGSLMEVSFPSDKGFSGTPLVSLSDGTLVGMLYGNSESSILQHIVSEVEDNGNREKGVRVCQEGVTTKVT